jgi:hypothetical protein
LNIRDESTLNLPIHLNILLRPINFSDPTDAIRHSKMVALVEHMLALHVKLAAATVPADKTLYQRQTRGELTEPSKPPTGR